MPPEVPKRKPRPDPTPYKARVPKTKTSELPKTSARAAVKHGRSNLTLANWIHVIAVYDELKSTRPRFSQADCDAWIQHYDQSRTRRVRATAFLPIHHPDLARSPPWIFATIVCCVNAWHAGTPSLLFPSP